MEQYALDLLGVGDHFVNECLNSGYKLDGWTEAYYENFKRLYSGLKEPSRIEEGSGKRPTLPISLESILIFWRRV